MGGFAVDQARGRIQQEETRLLAERLRVGLWILLGWTLAFTLGYVYLSRVQILPLFALKLGQIVAVIAAFLALRLYQTRAWVITVGLLTVAVAASVGAVVGAVVATAVASVVVVAVTVVVASTCATCAGVAAAAAAVCSPVSAGRVAPGVA